MQASHSTLDVKRWRVVIEPYKDTGRWRWLRDRKWRWARETLYDSGRGGLDKQGFASSHRAARRKALRGMVYDYPPYVRRVELVYALGVPQEPRWEPTPSPLKAELLREG